MKEILIPLNFTTTPAVYDTKQSFSTSDEASGVLIFTTTADVAGTVASLTIRNASENANRQTVLVERLDVNSSPFRYTLKNPLPFGQYEGTVLLKKNLTVIASARFLFGVNSSLSAEVLPDLVKANSLDELVENVETEVSNLKDAFSLTVSETVKGVNKTESTLQTQENMRYLNETTRKANELERISNENARVAAELERKETFDTLVDSNVIEQTVSQEVASEFQQIEATYANRLFSAEQQLEQAKTRTMTNKIYLKDCGLLGDYIFRTISSVFPSVTLAQVQALDSTATLSNAADWYILQKLIQESPDGTTIVIDGRYVVDKKLTISRSFLYFEGLDDVQYFESTNSCYLIKTISTTEPLFHFYNTHARNYIRDFVFDNLQLIGYVNKTTGARGGDAFLIDGHVMSFNLKKCRVNEFGGNGIYHKKGHFIYTEIDHTSFYFCCENGVYVKHRDTDQLNALILNKVDTIMCGYTWNGSAFVLPTIFSEKRGHGLNISGVAVSVTNGDSSGSGCGVLINTGAVMGLSVTGRYFEQSNMWDIYVMDRTGALPVRSLLLHPNMHVGNTEDLVKFEQAEFYNSSVVGEGIKNLEIGKADFTSVKDCRNEPYPGVNIEYAGNSKNYNLMTNANVDKFDVVSFIKTGDLRKSYRIKYDFEYVGGSTYLAYGGLTFSYGKDFTITNYINRSSQIGNAAKITSVTSMGGVYTINFDKPIQFAGWNKLLIAKNYEDLNGYSLKHACLSFAGEKYIIDAASVNFINDQSIQITGSYNLINTGFEIMCMNKTDALNSNSFLTSKLTMGSATGSKEVFFSIHTKEFPFLNFDLNNIRINFQVRTGRLNAGQHLIIKNLVFEEVSFPIIDKTTLWNDTFQNGLVIKDSVSKRLIKWTGSKWVYFDGEGDVI